MTIVTRPPTKKVTTNMRSPDISPNQSATAASSLTSPPPTQPRPKLKVPRTRTATNSAAFCHSSAEKPSSATATIAPTTGRCEAGS